MVASPQQQNRPVHLGRRDASVENTMERLNSPIEQLDTRQRIAHVNRVNHQLEIALHHATQAYRAAATSPAERDFQHFLELLLQIVQAAQALLLHQEHLETEEHTFLSRFLGVRAEEGSLAALNFQRRTEDLLQAIWQLMRLALVPYRALQQENQAALGPEDLQRYLRAYEALRKEFREASAAPA